MGSASKFIAALSCVASVAACAGSPPTGRAPARLAADGEIMAPAGLLEYCARTVGQCDSVLVDELRGSLPATGAPGGRRGLATPIAQDSAASASSVFRALLAARTGPVPERTTSEVVLNNQVWVELVTVNQRVNRAIRAATDQEIYGVEERWTLPLSDNPGAFSVRGDCEDYALEKRAQLLAAGWPADALALAVAVVPNVGLHAVLIVQTSGGDFVLDNLQSRPRRVDHPSYMWISRQVGPMLDHWSRASLGDGQARNAAVFEGGSSNLFQQHLSAARARARESGQKPEAVVPAPQAPASQNEERRPMRSGIAMS